MVDCAWPCASSALSCSLSLLNYKNHILFSLFNYLLLARFAFATKVADENSIVSREEFNRIFKVYNKYEKYLEEHELTNGEVDIAHRIIQESYEQRIRTHSFIEDARGYTKVDQ